MFTLTSYIKPLNSVLIAGVLGLLVSSCGTQNKAYNQQDGIYSSRVSARDSNSETSTDDKSNYYKQYFQSKSLSYENAQQEEDVIFTDIDAYATTERLDDEGHIVIEERYSDDYGPWGSNTTDVSVNIYNYGHGYGFWRPHYYSWGYPYYSYGYGNYWSIGFGWGSPFYYGHYGYYGSPYYGYPYYGYSYGNPYYYNSPSHTSYNRGRRNADYSRPAARGRNNVSTGNSNYSRNESSRRVNQNNVRANSNTGRNNSSIRNQPVRTQRTSPAPVRNNQNQTIRTQTPRPNTNTRSIQNNRTNTPTMSTPRSTPSQNTRTFSSPAGGGRSSGGAIRSSGGGGRSSGGIRGRG